jgi:hypothetical protein
MPEQEPVETAGSKEEQAKSKERPCGGQSEEGNREREWLTPEQPFEQIPQILKNRAEAHRETRMKRNAY